MDHVLFAAGAALAAPMSYLSIRSLVFREQEVAEAMQDLSGHEAFVGLSEDETRDFILCHMRSVLPLYACLALVGWAMVAAALLA